MKKIILLILLSVQSVFAAFEYKMTSAQSAGLCGIKTVTKPEAAAVFYNPALLPRKYEVSMFHTKLYGLDELSNNVLAISVPCFAIGYNSFGQADFYKEEVLALASSVNLGKQFKVGISFKSMLLDLGEMKTSTRICGVDVGCTINAGAKSFFGVMLSNVNRPKIGRKNPEEIYRDFSVGYSIEPIKNLRFMAEGFKIVGFESEARFAVEATFFQSFVLRSGFAPKTEVFSVGFGFNNFIDYAYIQHFDLGGEHFVSLKFDF